MTTRRLDDEGGGGHANFPEYQNVRIEPCAYEAYKKTGVFPNGTSPGQNADGSRTEPSSDSLGAAAAAPHESYGRGVMIYCHVEHGSVCIRSSRASWRPYWRCASPEIHEGI